MNFAPADVTLGNEEPVVATDLTNHSKLPDGTYKFVELYCTDPHCDCRKTIIQVLHNGNPVGSIDFGWESAAFYTKWAHGDKELGCEMQGWATSPLADYKLNPSDLIELLEELMDDEWLAHIKSTYQQIRKELKKQHHPTPFHSPSKPPSRNSPCPCGSGKKYKRCCIDQPLEGPASNITPFPGSFGPVDVFSDESWMDPLPEYDPAVEKKVEQALDHLQKSDFDRARDILFPLLDKHPGHASVPYSIGLYHALQERFEESIPYLEQATDLDPEFSEAWHNLGLSYRKVGNIPGSIQCAQFTLDYGDPKEPYVKKSRQFLKTAAKAIRKEKGLKLDDYVLNHITYDTAFMVMENGDPASAIEGFEAVLKLEPTHYQSHGNLALCHAMLGDKKSALHHLNYSLKIKPDYEVALSNKPLIKALPKGEKLALPMTIVNHGASGMETI